MQTYTNRNYNYCEPETEYFSLRKRYQSLKTNSTIGNYSCCLANVIGEGMSSQVYKGINTLTKQTVSIKVIQKQAMKDKKIDQLFRNEVKVLKQLNHDNILKLLGVQENEKQFWIITQYCDKGDLYKILKRNKKFSEQKAIEYFKDIIEGYKQLQKSEIIHRDLKPANILISVNKAKIADFGFAIYKKDLTSPNLNAGSPLYMPPQGLQKGQFSYKSDIFALGIMLYEMLHGKTPWTAATEKQLLYKMKNKSLCLDESLSQLTKKILRSCLNIDINKRINQHQLFQIMKVKNETQILSVPKLTTNQNYPKIPLRNITNHKNETNILKIKIEENIPNLSTSENQCQDQCESSKNIITNQKLNNYTESMTNYTNQKYYNQYLRNPYSNKSKYASRGTYKYLNDKKVINVDIKSRRKSNSVATNNIINMSEVLPLKNQVLDLVIKLKNHLRAEILSFLPTHLITKINFLVEIYQIILFDPKQVNFSPPIELRQDRMTIQVVECKNPQKFSKICLSFIKRMTRLICHYLKQTKEDFVLISQMITFYKHLKQIEQNNSYWRRSELVYQVIGSKQKLNQIICKYLI